MVNYLNAALWSVLRVKRDVLALVMDNNVPYEIKCKLLRVMMRLRVTDCRRDYEQMQ